MTITRKIDGKTIEIELTTNELMDSWNEAEEMMILHEANYRYDNELANDLHADESVIRNEGYKVLFKEAFLNAYADWEDNEAWSDYMPMAPYACMYEIAKRYFRKVYEAIEKHIAAHRIEDREAFIKAFAEKHGDEISRRFWDNGSTSVSLGDLLEAM